MWTAPRQGGLVSLGLWGMARRQQPLICKAPVAAATLLCGWQRGTQLVPARPQQRAALLTALPPRLQVLGVIEEVFSKEASEQLAALEARAAEEVAAAAATSQRKATQAGKEAAAGEGAAGEGKADRAAPSKKAAAAKAAEAAEADVAALQAAIADQAGEAVASDFVQVRCAWLCTSAFSAQLLFLCQLPRTCSCTARLLAAHPRAAHHTGPPPAPTTRHMPWPAPVRRVAACRPALQSKRANPPSVSGLLQAHKQQKAAAAPEAAAPATPEAGEQPWLAQPVMWGFSGSRHSQDPPRIRMPAVEHPADWSSHLLPGIMAAGSTALPQPLLLPVWPAQPPARSPTSSPNQTRWPRRSSCWACSWI